MKRITKLIVSALFAAVSGFWEMVLGLFGRRPGKCVILYYHSVPLSQRRAFARQMDVLLSCSEPLAADNRSPMPSGKRYAAVTFDDAFRNILSSALPELKARKIPSTIFVAPGLLGRTWHDDSAQSAADREIMSEEELKGIEPKLVRIGSHSFSHPSMVHLTPSEAKTELIESCQALQRLLDCPVTLFSFPYGAFNRNLVEWAREAGYERVFTVLPYLAFSDPAEFVSPRVRVDPTDWEIEFRLKLYGAYRWLPAAFAIKRTLFSKRLDTVMRQRASAGE